MTSRTDHAADLRLIAFLLARAARAIRSSRMERACEFLNQTQRLVYQLPTGAEKGRALTLIECLAMAGFERQTELEEQLVQAEAAAAAAQAAQ